MYYPLGATHPTVEEEHPKYGNWNKFNKLFKVLNAWKSGNKNANPEYVNNAKLRNPNRPLRRFFADVLMDKVSLMCLLLRSGAWAAFDETKGLFELEKSGNMEKHYHPQHQEDSCDWRKQTDTRRTAVIGGNRQTPGGQLWLEGQETDSKLWWPLDL